MGSSATRENHQPPRDVRGPVHRIELTLRAVDKRLGLRH
jgi:hypothetical protein